MSDQPMCGPHDSQAGGKAECDREEMTRDAEHQEAVNRLVEEGTLIPVSGDDVARRVYALQEARKLLERKGVFGSGPFAVRDLIDVAQYILGEPAVGTLVLLEKWGESGD